MSERTVAALVREGARQLAAAGIEDANFDAAQLFMAAADLDRTGLLLAGDQIPEEDAVVRFRSGLSRRLAGEPLQYVLGEWDFYGNRFAVGPGVLIPRPETEELTDLCVRALCGRDRTVVYDLCAGSGCIGVSVAAACENADVYLIERYDAAFSYLRRNIPDRLRDRTHPVRRDLFAGPDPQLPPPWLIVSNPPYIPAGEISSLQPEVLKEPATALDGGVDGMDFYRAIAALWYPVLEPGGILALECGEEQAAPVSRMFPGARVTLRNDAYGTQRFVWLQKEQKGKD